MVLAGSVAILATAILPYWIAATLPRSGPRFWGGIWYSPDDSLLLSVIREGMNGRWLHTPPYGSVHGPGAFFYPEYLLLGHLCRWLHLDPVAAFHLGRLACAAVMLATLWGFVGRFFANRGDRRFAFFLAATGGGLAWLLLRAFGMRSAELGAPEVYPFFASLTSLHVTLSIAALLWVMDTVVPRECGPAGGAPAGAGITVRRWTALVAGTIVLAVAQPFGCVLALLAGVPWAALRWQRESRVPRGETIAALVVLGLALPFVFHQLATIAGNPAYAGWRTQVRTPTPPLWQALCAIGLPLPFALLGLVEATRRRRANDLLLLGWIGAVVILLSLPYYQSRRFDLGAYVAFAVLAVRGLRARGWSWRGDTRVLATLANALGSLLVLGVCVSRILTRDPELFVRSDTGQALRCLQSRSRPGDVVLARWYTSLALLAAAPVRVVFGHPAETPRSERTSAAVSSFLAGGPLPPDSLAGPIRFILIEEPEGSRARIPTAFRTVCMAGGATLYERGSGPGPSPGAVPARPKRAGATAPPSP